MLYVKETDEAGGNLRGNLVYQINKGRVVIGAGQTPAIMGGKQCTRWASQFIARRKQLPIN